LPLPGLAWFDPSPQGWNISVAHSSSPNSSFLRHEAFCSTCRFPGSREFLFLENCIVILLFIFIICRFSSLNRVVIVKLPNNSSQVMRVREATPVPRLPQQHQQGLEELEATCLDQGSPRWKRLWPFPLALACSSTQHPSTSLFLYRPSQRVSVSCLVVYAFATGANTHRAIVHVNTCHMSCSLTTVLRLSQAY
jgi:hypothetical protein